MQAMYIQPIIPGKDKIGKDLSSKDLSSLGKKNAVRLESGIPEGNLLDQMNLATWNIVCPDKLGKEDTLSSKIFQLSFSGRNEISGHLRKSPSTNFDSLIDRLYSPKIFKDYFLKTGINQFIYYWHFLVSRAKEKPIKTHQI